MTVTLVRSEEASLARMSDTGTASISNNRIEQDHRGIKSRYGPMRGFGAVKTRQLASADVMMNSGTSCTPIPISARLSPPPLVAAASFKESALPSS